MIPRRGQSPSEPPSSCSESDRRRGARASGERAWWWRVAGKPPPESSGQGDRPQPSGGRSLYPDLPQPEGVAARVAVGALGLALNCYPGIDNKAKADIIAGKPTGRTAPGPRDKCSALPQVRDRRWPTQVWSQAAYRDSSFCSLRRSNRDRTDEGTARQSSPTPAQGTRRVPAARYRRPPRHHPART